ncbi:hypothetical protein OAB94_02310, partial [Flavobacteriaceae bacterium]|nr:hypothetical protein [Flavobacteriaceae bacterium]
PSTKIVQLSNYVKPAIVEDRMSDWVLNGKGNNFFQYVIDRYNGSPTNAALVDSYIDRLYGKGISIVNARTNASEYAALLSILRPRELKKIVSDFRLFGSAVGQIRYSKSGKRTIARIEHLERKMVAPGKINKDGEIDNFWVCSDWNNTNMNKPKNFKAFGYSSAPIEIFEIRPYKAGKTYYADPAYLAGLQYAMLEEEISNFSVNHIKNGLSMGWVINFNNGIPPEEKQEELERMVHNKTTGSNNAGRVIISFNDTKDTAPSVEAIPDNANHEQWQFWANEARQQLIVAHRVTSPMLFGVKDNTGLGNNAGELKEGSKLLHETVIRPSQNEILDVLQEIVAVNNISSPLTFIPLEDEEEKDDIKEEIDPLAVTEKPTQLSAHLDGCADKLISCGEDVDQDGWDCVMTEEVDYDLEETRDSFLQLASTGFARPNANSDQDSDQFKIRYQYAPLTAGSNSREFCRKMVSAEKVYRKEDIIMMGELPVNKGWGPKGDSATYSIWLYKGGGDCHHKWLRKTYVKQGSNVDVNSPLAKIISTAEARRQGDRTVNEKEVSMKPKDMPYNGFLPTNKRFL